MKLDDNTRSALHYLVLGLVIIGLPALVIGWIDARQAVAAADTELRVFRNGYLLHEPGDMTYCLTSRPERMAWAFLLAASVTIVVRIAQAALFRGGRSLVALVSGIVVLSWFATCGLWRPPLRSWFERGELVMIRRPVLVADLSLPWGTVVDRIPLEAQQTIVTAPMAQDRTLFMLDTSTDQIGFACAAIDRSQVEAMTVYLGDALAHWRSAGASP